MFYLEILSALIGFLIIVFFAAAPKPTQVKIPWIIGGGIMCLISVSSAIVNSRNAKKEVEINSVKQQIKDASDKLLYNDESTFKDLVKFKTIKEGDNYQEVLKFKEEQMKRILDKFSDPKYNVGKLPLNIDNLNHGLRMVQLWKDKPENYSLISVAITTNQIGKMINRNCKITNIGQMEQHLQEKKSLITQKQEQI